MVSTNISNIKNINVAYNSVENRLNDSVERLKTDYEEFTKVNVYYKKVGVGKIIISIIVDLVLLFLLLQNTMVTTWLQSNVEFREYGIEQLDNVSILSSLVFWILFIITAYCIFNTGVMFYCKKIERYSARINKVERKITKELEKIKGTGISNQLIQVAMQNQEYSIDSKNNLGDEIAKIRAGFMNTNQKAHNVKRFINIGISVVLFIFLVVYMFVKINGKVTVNPTGGLSIVALYVLATAIINITQYNAGEYMGRYSKIVGAVMAMVYGFILGICLKSNYSISAFELELTGVATKVNVAYIVIPFVQVVGIILTVFLSHYGLEKDKWENGFEVPMTFLSKSNGNKLTLLFRGGIATFLAFSLCGTVSATAVKSFGLIVTFAFLWYCANCIIKPRGSYLYTFWGRGRCIANEIVMVAMVLSAVICGRGTVSMEELICLGVAFVASFVIAGIATVINNVI